MAPRRTALFLFTYFIIMPAADRPPKGPPCSNKRTRLFDLPHSCRVCFAAPQTCRRRSVLGKGKNGGRGVERATRGVRKGLLCYVKRTKNCHRLSPFSSWWKGTVGLPYSPNTIRVRYFEWDYLEFPPSERSRPPMSVRGSWLVRALFGWLCGFDGARVVSYVFF